jgi:hypothetical protein
MMSEPQSPYTTNPDLLTRLLAVLEDWQWGRLLFYISNVINGTGWGEIHIVIKDGKMDEIAATMRDKPRKNP